jgi:glycosyltransferase involved in cell wall biosynthesis
MNSMRTIPATMRAIAPLEARTVVIDSGSTDGTVELCRDLGAEVLHRPWRGNVQQKRAAIEACGDSRWVLVLDSDEAPDERLVAAIRAAVAADRPDVAAYELNRRLVFHGRPLLRTFQPEWRLRLFRPSQVEVTGIPPHDEISVMGGPRRSYGVARLEGHLLHDSWANLEDLLRRSIAYARVSAEHAVASGTRGGGGVLDIAVRPGAAFLKQYLLRSGWRDGWRGLVVSGGAAAGVLMKHLAIAEARARARRDEPDRRY